VISLIDPEFLFIGLSPSLHSRLPNLRRFTAASIPQLLAMHAISFGMGTLIPAIRLRVFGDPFQTPHTLACSMGFPVLSKLEPPRYSLLGIPLTTLYVVADLTDIAVPSRLIERRGV
jgi:hypothetical protein